MSGLISILNSVDDDYLIGISNKGTLKRAYKDKEEIECAVVHFDLEDEEAEVKTGEETVKIKVPLSESTCTCPSRSICRHVVLGILVLCEQNGKSMDSTNTEEKNADIGENKDNQDSPVCDKAEVQTDSNEKEKVELKTKEDSKTSEINTLQNLKEELAGYPVEKAIKLIGIRRYTKLIDEIKLGVKAEINETSIVTVKLPSGNHVIKLLYPLEHSACTCHKKEFCAHKAEAVIWYKHQNNLLNENDMVVNLGNVRQVNDKEIKEVALALSDFIEAIINTGLSRISYDILDAVDRMALLCHNAGLANFEGYFRSLRESFDAYLKRKASFKTEALMNETMRLYRRIKMLCEIEDSSKLAGLAGNFRGEYQSVANLELTTVTATHFTNRSGYEGETYYFIENNTREWYSYTVSRPMFYENKRRTYTEMSEAPWGLDINMRELCNIHFKLNNAKFDDRKRLSSTQDSKGEIIETSHIDRELVSKWYYDDFTELFEEQMIKNLRKWITPKKEMEARESELIFVNPSHFDKAEFIQKEQKLVMRLVDSNDIELWIEVQYNKLEENGIKFLEKLLPEKNLCFLGKVYIKNGRMCMYPITVVKISKDSETADERQLNEQNEEECNTEGSLFNEKVSIIEYIQTLLKDISVLMADLYQGGLIAINDSIIAETGAKAEKLRDIEMTLMSEKLEKLKEKLEMHRHLFDEKKQQNISEILEIYAYIVEYLYIGIQKTEYDIVKESIQYKRKRIGESNE